LVGEVVAKKEQSLADNPIVQNTTNINKLSKFDTHLSVPEGKVNVGKFFYPKQHPSFFEQPMFSATTKGKFELKQVLGSLNAQNPEVEEQLIEKYRQTDFHGKRFLLTSHPLGRHRPKGNIRWSIKYNRYVGEHSCLRFQVTYMFYMALPHNDRFRSLKPFCVFLHVYNRGPPI
jgi:hypothetical protein